MTSKANNGSRQKSQSLLTAIENWDNEVVSRKRKAKRIDDYFVVAQKTKNRDSDSRRNTNPRIVATTTTNEDEQEEIEDKRSEPQQRIAQDETSQDEMNAGDDNDDSGKVDKAANENEEKLDETKTQRLEKQQQQQGKTDFHDDQNTSRNILSSLDHRSGCLGYWKKSRSGPNQRHCGRNLAHLLYPRFEQVHEFEGTARQRVIAMALDRDGDLLATIGSSKSSSSNNGGTKVQIYDMLELRLNKFNPFVSFFIPPLAQNIQWHTQDSLIVTYHDGIRIYNLESSDSLENPSCQYLECHNVSTILSLSSSLEDEAEELLLVGTTTGHLSCLDTNAQRPPGRRRRQQQQHGSNSNNKSSTFFQKWTLELHQGISTLQKLTGSSIILVGGLFSTLWCIDIHNLTKRAFSHQPTPALLLEWNLYDALCAMMLNAQHSKKTTKNYKGLQQILHKKSKKWPWPPLPQQDWMSIHEISVLLTSHQTASSSFSSSSSSSSSGGGGGRTARTKGPSSNTKPLPLLANVPIVITTRSGWVVKCLLTLGGSGGGGGAGGKLPTEHSVVTAAVVKQCRILLAPPRVLVYNCEGKLLDTSSNSNTIDNNSNNLKDCSLPTIPTPAACIPMNSGGRRRMPHHACGANDHFYSSHHHLLVAKVPALKRVLPPKDARVLHRQEQGQGQEMTLQGQESSLSSSSSVLESQSQSHGVWLLENCESRGGKSAEPRLAFHLNSNCPAKSLLLLPRTNEFLFVLDQQGTMSLWKSG